MKRLDSYSQHFLRSPDFIKELIGHSSIRQNDTVWDIGAGSGAITAVLARRVKWVVAVEVEPNAAKRLRENVKRMPNVEVIEKDFLKMDLPTTPYRIFANIPFHLSSEIVRKITASPNPPKSTTLIVQKQFARKLLIDTDFFTGQLGAMIAPWFAVKIRRPLRKTDYTPPPNVDTVLVELKPREEALIPYEKMGAYQEMVAGAYHDPKIFAKLPLRKAGVMPGVKPSELTLNQWLTLFQG